MLEAPKRFTTSSQIRFVPRQIMLESRKSVAAQEAAEEPKKEKKEKKEKKKEKQSSKAADEGHGGLETLDLYRVDVAAAPQKGKGRGILLRSIAAFLESNGFTKTLSALQSEAQHEIDSWKSSILNLEDLFCKFLEPSTSHAEASIDWPQEQDAEKVGIVGEVKAENIHDDSERTHKKKRKKSDGIGDGAKAETSNTGTKNDSEFKASEDSHVETKEKKGKKKSVSNSLEETAEKNQIEVSHGTAENALPKPGENDKEKRKKKHKMISDSCNGNAETGKYRKFQDTVKEKIEELKSLIDNSSEPMHEDEKKKKQKVNSDSVIGKVEHQEIESSQGVSKKKRKDSKPVGCESDSASKVLDSIAKNTPTENSSDNKDSQTEKKKKKKDKLPSERAVNCDQVGGGTSLLNRCNVGENVLASANNVDSAEKKNSKKRKKFASEGKEVQGDTEIAGQEPKVKSEDAENNKEPGPIEKADRSLLNNDDHVPIKKRKLMEENSKGTRTSGQKLVLVEGKENDGGYDSQKVIGDRLVNGNIEKEEDGAASSKAMKKEKCSAEPKAINAFTRVKVDEVEFPDERLRDNSYWAKDGADTGYGAKAQEILGQVRGRNFRHEKTKKKRGTYRGGQIDLQSYSIKFSDSDE